MYTSYAERYSSIVYLIVGVLLQKSVRNLCQAESLFAVDHQRHDPHPEQYDRADLLYHRPTSAWTGSYRQILTWLGFGRFCRLLSWSAEVRYKG